MYETIKNVETDHSIAAHQFFFNHLSSFNFIQSDTVTFFFKAWDYCTNLVAVDFTPFFFLFIVSSKLKATSIYATQPTWTAYNTETSMKADYHICNLFQSHSILFFFYIILFNSAMMIFH